jgi:hypothetical protein
MLASLLVHGGGRTLGRGRRGLVRRIHYNATILSHLLAHKENTGDKYGADLVKEVSPVAWQDINLYGRYEFRQQPAPVDVEEIVRELADVQIETDSTLAA